MMDKTIAVLGTGANGSCVAADLTNAGLDVVLIDQWPAHVEAMRANGLHVTLRQGEIHAKVRAFHLCELASMHRAFDIVLKRAGKTLTVPADKSILQALAEAGIKIKTLCKEGVCGTCRVGLVSGHADHRDEVLTDDERERNIQVCVSRAQPGETLVLDL